MLTWLIYEKERKGKERKGKEREGKEREGKGKGRKGKGSPSLVLSWILIPVS